MKKRTFFFSKEGEGKEKRSEGGLGGGHNVFISSGRDGKSFGNIGNIYVRSCGRTDALALPGFRHPRFRLGATATGLKWYNCFLPPFMFSFIISTVVPFFFPVLCMFHAVLPLFLHNDRMLLLLPQILPPVRLYFLPLPPLNLLFAFIRSLFHLLLHLQHHLSHYLPPLWVLSRDMRKKWKMSFLAGSTRDGPTCARVSWNTYSSAHVLFFLWD